MTRLFGAVLVVSMSLVLAAGCGSKGSDVGTTDGDHADYDHGHDDHAHDDHGHDDHGHDEHAHGPAGPNGGHTESFDQPGFTFEWLHDDAAQTVTVFILDEAKKNAVPVVADMVTMASDKGQKPQTFELLPVSPDAEGRTAKFELKDGGLIVAIQLGVDVSVTIDGTTYTRKLEPHHH